MAANSTGVLNNLRQDWYILTSLVVKDFRLKYRRSILGVVWSVLNPLLMMIVLSAVFTVFSNNDPNTQPFPVYLILGMTLFSLMTNSTTGGASSIISSAPLIKKIRINKVLFPLQKVLFELVNFSFSMVAVIAVMLAFRIIPTINLLFLPLLLFYVVLFCAGLSLLLAALAVFFADIIYLWGVVITAWTYATPVFYSPLTLPDYMQIILRFNPMYHYINYFRLIAMHGQMPTLRDNLICLVMAVITFVAGLAVFKATEKRFVLFV